MGRVLAVPEQEMLTFRVGKDSPGAGHHRLGVRTGAMHRDWLACGEFRQGRKMLSFLWGVLNYHARTDGNAGVVH